ncbi:Diphthamide synthase [Gracilaria domingensis]|nr:Diphthamide synthase [Gracilaria domingensis]
MIKSMPFQTVPLDIEELHQAACKAKQSHYVDPDTKLMVFTAYYLSKRKCCGCGCRHCPYKPRTLPHQTSRLLHGKFDDLPPVVDVLFWSGGKDSYLAFRAMRRAALRPVILLTTFDAASGIVAHQEVSIGNIVRQAKTLNVPLLGIPVEGGAYVRLVTAGLDRLRDHGVEIMRVAFGDLHLQHVRTWRESELTALGAQLFYPVWGVPYQSLLKELEDSNITIRISAVDRDRTALKHVKIGDKFSSQFVNQLSDEIDRFGENGEFHTLVELWR